MDRLELKSATDRTLGVGVIEGQSELLVLTAATMMKAYFDMDQIVKFDPEYVLPLQRVLTIPISFLQFLDRDTELAVQI